MRPFEIVVDGTDSSGKTPCVEALCCAFATDRTVRTCAPFRVHEVYPLWENEPRQAAAIILAVMEDFRRNNASADVIVWDRGWPTVWVSTADPAVRDAFLPFPDSTVLLLNSIETTRRKVKKHRLTGVWVNDPALVHRYHDAYHALPREVENDSLAVFFPDPDGRYNYSTISEFARSAANRSG